MAVWNRSHKTDEDQSDDESVSLADDSHAWWAARDELKRAWQPPKKKASANASSEPQPTSRFEQKYSSESLFNWADGPEPDALTHGGQGTLLDPYSVLGLQPGASIDEVVTAHRNLAKTYHPDRQFDATEEERIEAGQTIRRINAAYEELRSRLIA